jgi:hypothetical protein
MPTDITAAARAAAARMGGKLMADATEDELDPEFFAAQDPERTDENGLCIHPLDERTTRVAHGFLGDAPRGTVQTCCTGCGSVVEVIR